MKTSRGWPSLTGMGCVGDGDSLGSVPVYEKKIICGGRRSEVKFQAAAAGRVTQSDIVSQDPCSVRRSDRDTALDSLTHAACHSYMLKIIQNKTAR